MGKTQRTVKKKRDTHQPLAVQMKEHKEAIPSKRKEALKKKARKGELSEAAVDACGHGGLAMERDGDGFLVPNKVSALILQQAREQREEIAREETEMEGGEEEEEVEIEYDETSSVATETPIEDHEDIEVDEEEARLMAQFAPEGQLQSRNLADIIMGKIKNKEREADEAMSRASRGDGASTIGASQFDPRFIKVYKTIGKILKRYTTGKVPKAFKVLPHLQGWETLLWLTAPHEWSPHALYAATRIFAHTANELMAQRFYNVILLPSVRASFKRTGRLHSHTFASIRKAMWKPAAFNKGFLLPFCAEEDLTLKEAVVVSSVLSKTSMPPAHAMVAIAKISQMKYNGSSSVVLRMLLDKGYNMAYAVVDMLVKHFHQFIHETRQLPVLWHQCLLTFVQRYKELFMAEQVDLIRRVVNKHNHILISSEIRRELIQLENHWKKIGGCPSRRQQAPLNAVH